MKKEEDKIIKKITKKIYADAALTGTHGIVVAVVGCRGPVWLHGLGMFQKIHQSKRGENKKIAAGNPRRTLYETAAPCYVSAPPLLSRTPLI